MLVKLDILWNYVVKSNTKIRAFRFRLLNTNHGALHCTQLYNHRLNSFSLWAQHSWFNSLLKSPNPSSYFSQDWSKSTEPSCLRWMTVNTPSVDDRGQYHKETVILKLNENLFSEIWERKCLILTLSEFTFHKKRSWIVGFNGIQAAGFLSSAEDLAAVFWKI